MANTHEIIEHDRETALLDRHLIRVYREYVDGDHLTTLTTEQMRILGPDATNPLADNVFDMVLSASASRLELTGFDVEDDAVAEFLRFDIGIKNNLGKLSYDTHYAMLRDGDHFIGLDWLPTDASGAGRVILKRERVWDGVSGMFMAYDDAGLPTYAVKEFTAAITPGAPARKRRVIYYADRIERWVEDGRGWKPYTLPGDPTNPVGAGIPWLKRDNTPIGIPVVHFANGSRGDDSSYGRSDLKGLLALQDDVNSIQNDISAAAKFTGFKMYYATGVDPNAVIKVGPGYVIKTENAAAKFGDFAPGEIKPLIEAHGHKRQTIAINTSTPLHVITGSDWPSGMALLRAEMPLVSKVQRLAKGCGPSWTTVAHRATEIADAFGGMAFNEDVPITSVFSSAEKLDDQAILEIQQAKVELYTKLLALDDPIMMEKTGLLSKDEINQIMAAKEVARDKMANQLANTGGFV